MEDHTKRTLANLSEFQFAVLNEAWPLLNSEEATKLDYKALAANLGKKRNRQYFVGQIRDALNKMVKAGLLEHDRADHMLYLRGPYNLDEYEREREIDSQKAPPRVRLTTCSLSIFDYQYLSECAQEFGYAHHKFFLAETMEMVLRFLKNEDRNGLFQFFDGLRHRADEIKEQLRQKEIAKVTREISDLEAHLRELEEKA